MPYTNPHEYGRTLGAGLAQSLYAPPAPPEPDQLFEQYNHGRIAEEQLSGLPEQPAPKEDIAHRATLLKIAHSGRIAEETILSRPELSQTHAPRFKAVQDYAQWEKDKEVTDKLARGELVIGQEDVQRLQNNMAARSKIGASLNLTEEQKRQAIQQSYADDARIRRSAMPIPPEAKAQSWETKLNGILQGMAPETRQRYQGLIVPDKEGGWKVPRGATPEPQQPEQAVQPPLHHEPVVSGQNGHPGWVDEPGLPGIRKSILPDGTIIFAQRHQGKVEFHEHKPTAPKETKPITPEKRLQNEELIGKTVEARLKNRVDDLVKRALEVSPNLTNKEEMRQRYMEIWRPMIEKDVATEMQGETDQPQGQLGGQQSAAGPAAPQGQPQNGSVLQRAIQAARNGDARARSALEQRGIKWQ